MAVMQTVEEARNWLNTRMQQLPENARGAYQTISGKLEEIYNAGGQLVVETDNRFQISARSQEWSGSFQQWMSARGTDVSNALQTANATIQPYVQQAQTAAAPIVQGTGNFLKDHGLGIGAAILTAILGIAAFDMSPLLGGLLALAVGGGADFISNGNNSLIGQLLGMNQQPQAGTAQPQQGAAPGQAQGPAPGQPYLAGGPLPEVAAPPAPAAPAQPVPAGPVQLVSNGQALTVPQAGGGLAANPASPTTPAPVYLLTNPNIGETTVVQVNPDLQSARITGYSRRTQDVAGNTVNVSVPVSNAPNIPLTNGAITPAAINASAVSGPAASARNLINDRADPAQRAIMTVVRPTPGQNNIMVDRGNVTVNGVAYRSRMIGTISADGNTATFNNLELTDSTNRILSVPLTSGGGTALTYPVQDSQISEPRANFDTFNRNRLPGAMANASVVMSVQRPNTSTPDIQIPMSDVIINGQRYAALMRGTQNADGSQATITNIALTNAAGQTTQVPMRGPGGTNQRTFAVTNGKISIPRVELDAYIATQMTNDLTTMQGGVVPPSPTAITATPAQLNSFVMQVRNGNVAVARATLQATPALAAQLASAKGADGLPVLNTAASAGNREMVQLLLANGANVNGTNNQNETALHWAAYNGNSDIVNDLVAGGANLRAQNGNGETPLDVARRMNRTAVVTRLEAATAAAPAAAAATPTAQQTRDFMALITSNNEAGATAMLRENPTIANALANSRDAQGAPALNWAVSNQRVGMVELLLANGANVNTPNRNNETPLHFAAARGNRVILDKLLEAGANPTARNSANETPLMVAQRAPGPNQAAIVATLQGVAVPAAPTPSSIMNTAIIFGVNNNNVNAVRTALRDNPAIANALANAQDSSGAPVLNLAAANQNLEMVNLLLANGANVDGQNSRNETALHWAAYRGNQPIVDALLAAGADTSLLNSQNQTPVQVAQGTTNANRNAIVAALQAPRPTADSGVPAMLAADQLSAARAQALVAITTDPNHTPSLRRIAQNGNDVTLLYTGMNGATPITRTLRATISGNNLVLNGVANNNGGVNNLPPVTLANVVNNGRIDLAAAQAKAEFGTAMIALNTPPASGMYVRADQPGSGRPGYTPPGDDNLVGGGPVMG